MAAERVASSAPWCRASTPRERTAPLARAHRVTTSREALVRRPRVLDAWRRGGSAAVTLRASFGVEMIHISLHRLYGSACLLYSARVSSFVFVLCVGLAFCGSPLSRN